MTSMPAWPLGMSVVLIKLIDVGRHGPLWVAPLLRQSLLNCVRETEHKQAREHECIHCSQLLTVDVM